MGRSCLAQGRVVGVAESLAVDDDGGNDALSVVQAGDFLWCAGGGIHVDVLEVRLVFPNDGRFSIRLILEKPGEVNYRLTDGLGREVATGQIGHLPAGENQVLLDFSNKNNDGIVLTEGFEASSNDFFSAEIIDELSFCETTSDYLHDDLHYRFFTSIYGPRMLTVGGNINSAYDFHRGEDMVDKEVLPDGLPWEEMPDIISMCDGNVVAITNGGDEGKSVIVECATLFNAYALDIKATGLPQNFDITDSQVDILDVWGNGVRGTLSLPPNALASPNQRPAIIPLLSETIIVDKVKMNIYPNPTSDESVNVTLNIPEEQEWQLSVTNLSGQVLMNARYTSPPARAGRFWGKTTSVSG